MIHNSNLPRQVEKVAAWRRRSAALPLLTSAILLAAIATGRAEEFMVTSRWQYPATPLATGKLLAHGQADISDTSTNAQLGGIGFYCTPTQNYIDVFVHVSGMPIEGIAFGNRQEIVATSRSGSQLGAAEQESLIEYPQVRLANDRSREPWLRDGPRRIDATEACIPKADSPTG